MKKCKFLFVVTHLTYQLTIFHTFLIFVMPGLIYFDEIKKALGLPPKARLVTVEKALLRRNLPFEYGEKGVFSTP